jgi:hypothetical protein
VCISVSQYPKRNDACQELPISGFEKVSWMAPSFCTERQTTGQTAVFKCCVSDGSGLALNNRRDARTDASSSHCSWYPLVVNRLNHQCIDSNPYPRRLEAKSSQHAVCQRSSSYRVRTDESRENPRDVSTRNRSVTQRYPVRQDSVDPQSFGCGYA